MIRSSKYNVRQGVCMCSQLADAVIDFIEPEPVEARGRVEVDPQDRSAEAYGAVSSPGRTYWQGGVRADETGLTHISSNRSNGHAD